jgi:hypothetical protein
MEELTDVVWDENVRTRRMSGGTPMINIVKYGREKAKITFSKVAEKLILGTNTSLSIMLGLGKNNIDLYIKVCDASEPGARPMNSKKGACHALTIASIGEKLGVTPENKFIGELVTIHRDMYMVELKMIARNPNSRGVRYESNRIP